MTGHLASGPPTGPSTAPDFVHLGDDGGEMLGLAVAAVDADADGLASLIFGAPDFVTAFEQSQEGRVGRFRGVPAVPPDADAPFVTITAPGDGDVIGAASVLLAADVADASATTVSSSPARRRW